MSSAIEKTIRAVVGALLALAGSACQGTGDLTVLLEAEDTITSGLDPGNDVANIRDGWQVRFSQYLMAVGDIDLFFATDNSRRARAGDVFVVDLAKIPAAGLPLWDVVGLAAGRWEFSYAAAGAANAIRHDSVSDADFAKMRGDWSYLLVGTMTKADGRSCPPATRARPPAGSTPVGRNRANDPCYANPSISFALGAAVATRWGPCEVDGSSGVAVPDGGAQTVAVTIHGDHLFFNGFPAGGEGSVERLAQWLADTDLDLDTMITQAELEAIAPTDLAEIDTRYQLGASPITPLNTMWDYVIAQLKTQGHFQGEGECPVNGLGT